MKPIHPGRILKREMTARNLSANKLALALRVPSGRITQILNGKRGISAETALRLGQYFNNNAQFWMNLQSKYDLITVEQNIGAKVIAEVEQAQPDLPPEPALEHQQGVVMVDHADVTLDQQTLLAPPSEEAPVAVEHRMRIGILRRHGKPTVRVVHRQPRLATGKTGMMRLALPRHRRAAAVAALEFRP